MKATQGNSELGWRYSWMFTIVTVILLAFLATDHAMGLEPAGFNVIVKYKPAVVQVQNGSLQNITIDSESRITIPGIAQEDYQPGTIFLDEASKQVLKVDTVDSVNEGFVQIREPELHEIFETFEIPEQTIQLNIANIKESVVPPIPVNSLMSCNLGQRSWGNGIELNFYQKTVTGKTFNGGEVTVTLDGQVLLETFSITGKYSCFGGYKFALTAREKINLAIQTNIDMDEEVFIPLLGFDIPCDIASVSAGLFLIANIDGNFTLEVGIKQGISAEIGVWGGTRLYIPTSFKPYKNFDSEKFDINTDFSANINGSLAISPLVKLKLLGKTIFFANLSIGAKLNVKEIHGNLLNADIYGFLGSKIELIGKTITLIDKTYFLYQAQKPNTPGYKVDVLDVCSYRGLVRGNIKIEKEGESGFEPLSKKNITILHLRSNDNDNDDDNDDDWNNKAEPEYIQTDHEGNFSLDDLELWKGDQIRIQIANVTTPSLETTIPFPSIQTEYVDFFQDRIKGEVPSKYDFIAKEYIHYNGPVQMFLNGEPEPFGQTDSVKGVFSIDHDFKPMDKAYTYININGHQLYSHIVDADTDLKIWNFAERHPYFDSVVSKNDEGKIKAIEFYQNNELRIVNTRGFKKVAQPGRFKASFVPGEFRCGLPTPTVDGIENTEIMDSQVTIHPEPEFFLQSHGDSSASVTWWYEWKHPQGDATDTPFQLNPSIELEPVVPPLEFTTSNKYVDTATNPLLWNYDYDWEFSFEYEGHTFTHTSEDQDGGCQPALNLVVLNPMEQLLSDLIDSHINPFDSAKNSLDKGSVRNNLLEFSPESAVDSINLIEQNSRNLEKMPSYFLPSFEY